MSEKVDSAHAIRIELDASVRQLREMLRAAGEAAVALRIAEKEIEDTKNESATLRDLLSESEKS
jgi:hypothetical protein